MADRTVLFLESGALKGVSSTADNLLGAGLKSGAATDITLARAGAAGTTVTIDADSVDLGSSLASLNAGAATFNLVNTTATTVNFAGAATTIVVGSASCVTDITNDMIIRGDLTVEGTTITTHSEEVNIGDNTIYMNYGYTTAAGFTGGVAVNYLPTATADTVAATGFVAGVAAVSNPYVNTTGVATFAQYDIIQISGAADPDNNGLFEVHSHAGNILTIKGIGTVGTIEQFTQNQFDTDTTVQGAITKVNVSVIRAGTDGEWEVGKGSNTTASGITFTDITVGPTVTLQNAYEAGNTITTAVADGNVIVQGTEDFVIGGSVDVSMTSNGTINQSGNGQVTFTGNVDATGGLDVTGANLTVATSAILNGDVQLGDAVADTVTQNALWGSNFYFTDANHTIGYNSANGRTLTFDNAGAGALTAILPGTHNETDLGSGAARFKLGYFQGDVTTAGNFVSGASITVNGTTNTISGSAGLTIDPTTTLTLELTDNNVSALSIKEGANNYFSVDTSDAGASISFGNATTNPDINLLGTGTVSLAGGLDVAGATTLDGAVTLGDAAGDAVTITGTVQGNLTFSDANHTIGVTSSANNRTITFDNPGAGRLDVQVNDNLLVGGGLDVTGNSQFYGSVALGDAAGDAINIIGNCALSGVSNPTFNFGSSGNVTATGNPTFNFGTSLSTFAGNVNISGTLTANGPVNLGDAAGDTVTVKGNVALSGATNPTFDFGGSGNVTATGNPTFNFGTSLSTFGGAATVTGTLTGNGDVTLGSDAGDTITVNGTTTFNNAVVTIAGGNDINFSTTTSTINWGGAAMLEYASDVAAFQAGADGTRALRVPRMSGAQRGALDVDPASSAAGMIVYDTDADRLYFYDDGATAWIQLSAAGATTLQAAYEAGNTITTAGAEGNVILGGTEDFVIQNTVDVSITTTGTITQTGAGQITLNGNIDATNGLDVTVANLTVGGANFSVTPAGVMTVASTSNLNGPVNLGDGAGDNIAVNGTVTTNLIFSDTNKTIGYNSANARTLTFDNTGAGALSAILPGTTAETDLGANGTRFKAAYFSGDVTTNGNFVSGASITVNGTTNTISGSASLTLDPTTTLTLELTDNSATALQAAQGGNAYITVDTTDGSEVVTWGNATTNPDFTMAGSGTFTLPTKVTATAIGNDFVAAAGGVSASRVVYKNTTASEVAHASNAAIGTANTIVGVARAAIAAAQTGPIDNYGVVTLDAAAGISIAAGDVVYLETNGEVTNVAPSASGTAVAVLGYAKTASAAGGTFTAYWAPRTPVVNP